MEVEIPQEKSTIEIQPQDGAPKFIWELSSATVMDGEEVKFQCKVVGTPAPEITWYHDDQVVTDNPDFR